MSKGLQEYEKLQQRAKDEGFTLFFVIAPGLNVDPKKYGMKHISYADETLSDSIKTLNAYMDDENVKKEAKNAYIDDVWSKAAEVLKERHGAEVMLVASEIMIQETFPDIPVTSEMAEGFLNLVKKRVERKKKGLPEVEEDDPSALTVELAQEIVDNSETMKGYKITRVNGTTYSGTAWYDLGDAGEKSLIIVDGKIAGAQG